VNFDVRHDSIETARSFIAWIFISPRKVIPTTLVFLVYDCVGKRSCQCACHPAWKQENSNRLVIVSQMREVEKRSGNLVVALFLTQLKHLKPHWVLGRSHGLSTRLRSGCHFANLYYYFAACRQTQRKFDETALKNGRHIWFVHG
jgi:hypothetical protein